MLNNLLKAKNLTKLTNEIDDYYKNGIYVFLKPSETYDVIDDYFISNCVAVVSKGENDNVLLDDEVKDVSFNGYALNANKQYNKMFSVSPYLITQTNINKMSTTKKEDVIKFLDDTFCEQFLNKNIEDVFKFYKNGKQDKEYSKEVQDLIKNKSKDTIDEMIESAKVTKEFVDNNYDFIQKVNGYFIEKTNENKSYALLRVNFIIADDIEKIKDHMDFYLKIRTYANRRSAVSPIVDGKGYMYTFMSAMYNQKKPFVGLNRSDFELNGNEMISIDDLDLHVNLFKYVKFVSESTRFKNANIFIKDDEIKKFGDNGSTVYTFKNVKSSYYLIDVRTITAYKKNAQRDFNFEYEVVSYKKEDKKTVIIDSYAELAKHIFYGSKDKGISNQLFVDLKGKDNNRIRNKFYEGNELRDESKKIMSKFEAVSNFEEDESIVLPILKDISNLLFSNSNFDGDTVYSAKIKYRNMLNFWGGLLEKFGGNPIDKKEIDLKQPIKNEEDYITTLSKGIVYIYDYVNKQKSQPLYTSRHFSELVNTLDVKKLERMFKINYSKNSYLLLDNSEVYGRMLLSSILSNDLKVKGSLKNIGRVSLTKYRYKKGRDMTNKTNNSLGFTGVITSMASFNAEVGDNSGSRTTNKGVFYATHYKMKWLIRNYYARTRGEDSVLVKGKRYLKDGVLAVQTLEERLSDIFKIDNKALKALGTDGLLNLIVEKQDVKNFGIALALTGQNAKITGVSQLSYAKNIYEDTEEQDIQINGAYASKTGAGNNTLGRRKFLDFANYVYNFTIQPSNLSSDMVGFDLENKYTEDDYNWFKRGMLKSVQDNQSSSSGSTVAYGMFIDLKDGEDLVQSNFSDYITCTDVEDSDEKTTREQKVVDFTKLAEYISKITDAIEYSEIYLVDNISIKFEGVEELKKHGVVIKNMSESRKI